MGQDGLIPTAYRLYQNYPNPFNPTTIIPYDLPEASKVSLKIYNILGQEVYNWNFRLQEAGKYQVAWDGTNNQGVPVGSGLYFVKLNAGDYICSKKMILLR